jgi:hypothetical protein
MRQFDSTPTHSIMKPLYKYPHAAFDAAGFLETGRFGAVAVAGVSK